MGMTEGVSVQASSIAVLLGVRGQCEGRETIICGGCGRAQFNKGQLSCVACHASLLAVLEPLTDCDATPAKKHPQICTRLRDLRRMLEIPQGLLAVKVRCARPHISRYERGLIIPTIAFLDRVTQGLRITMAEMLDETITLEELALRSLLRSPGDGEFIQTMIRFLPKLNKNSRALLIENARSFHSSPGYPHRQVSGPRTQILA